MNNELVIFETKDNDIKLYVPVDRDTVWLTQAQMTELFNVDRTVITRHVNNVFKEQELIKESNVQKMHIANSDKPVQFYSLEVIISVGYRVKSQRGVEFRQWANKILKQYVIQGYAINEKRLQALEKTVDVKRRQEKYLEHFGMMGDIDYVSNMMLKIATYEQNNIFTGVNILATRNHESGNLEIGVPVLGNHLFCA